MIPPQTTVLVVEDEALIAMSTVAALEDAGYCVVSALTTADAEQILTGSQSIGAAVLDYHLRGETTMQLAEQLARRGIPFVLCSGTVTQEPAPAFRKAPFVMKPFADETLVLAVRTALSQA